MLPPKPQLPEETDQEVVLRVVAEDKMVCHFWGNEEALVYTIGGYC